MNIYRCAVVVTCLTHMLGSGNNKCDTNLEIWRTGGNRMKKIFKGYSISIPMFVGLVGRNAMAWKKYRFHSISFSFVTRKWTKPSIPLNDREIMFYHHSFETQVKYNMHNKRGGYLVSFTFFLWIPKHTKNTLWLLTLAWRLSI